MHTCRETALQLALGGALPALLALRRSRRSPQGARDRASRLLCAIALHGEAGTHCLQHGLLSTLTELLHQHSHEGVRGAASAAATALLQPKHALFPLLERGEVAPLLSFLLAPAQPNAESAAFVTAATPLLARSAIAAKRALFIRAAPLLAPTPHVPPSSPDAGGARGFGSSPPPSPGSAAGATAITPTQLEAAMLLCLFVDGTLLQRPAARSCLLYVALADASPSSDAGPAELLLSRAVARVLASLLRAPTTTPTAPAAAASAPGQRAVAPAAAPAAVAALPPRPPSLSLLSAVAVLEAIASRLDEKPHGSSMARGAPALLVPQPVEMEVLEYVLLGALEECHAASRTPASAAHVPHPTTGALLPLMD